MQGCARTAPFSGQHRAWPVAGECAGMPRVSYVVRRTREPSMAARLRCGAYQPVPAALGQYQCSKRRNLSVPPTGIHTKHMHHPASCIQRRVACNVPRKMQDARCENECIHVQHPRATCMRHIPCALCLYAQRSSCVGPCELHAAHNGQISRKARPSRRRRRSTRGQSAVSCARRIDDAACHTLALTQSRRVPIHGSLPSFRR